MKALFLALTTVAFTSALLSCSAHEFANPQRKSNADCVKAGGKPIGDKFCLLGGNADGGGVDAGPRSMDAGPDAMMAHDAGGDAAIDAGPPPEACGKTNDTRSCYHGDDAATALQPPCKVGTQTCRDGFWSDCEGEVLPKAETCDGVDNDCDGKTDEDQTPVECQVQNQQGACAAGLQLCKEGMPICAQIIFPMTEVCNGKDDDCNGMTDEHTELGCYAPDDGGCTARTGGGYDCVGACKQGFKTCDDGAYGDCTGSVGKQPNEICTAAGDAEADENCNGMTDEGCTCHSGDACYTGPQGTAGVGPCKAGTKTCSDTTHATCTGEVVPVAEDCSNEGTDDDCNGMKDDWALRGTSCSSMSTAQGACKAGATWQCASGQATCKPSMAGTEVCDGMGGDEDCDGKMDEGFDLSSDSNNCGACGHKCSASQTCCDGSCVDTRSSNANCSGCGKSCLSGQTCCDSSCKNTKSDPNNCGSCGTVCPSLSGCTNSSCVLLGL